MNFTYLLGAGASWNAIPIGKEIGARMQFHVRVFNDTWKGRDLRNGIDEYIERLTTYPSIIERFSSIDTYAKFLYLTGQKARYQQLKKDLIFFFFLEQNVNFRGIYEKEAKADGYWPSEDKKKENLDSRYLSFFISLFSNREWPSNVKILTWNYDVQMEMALTDLKLSYQTYPSDESPSEINIFHLNGVAALGGPMRDIDFREKIKIDDLEHCWNGIKSANRNESHLRFAWEGEASKKLDPVRTHLSNTDILVVIGYSFPFFNRSIDGEMFKAMNSLRTIYIQNKEDGQFLYDQFPIERPSITPSFSQGRRPSREPRSIEEAIATDNYNGVLIKTIDKEKEAFHLPFEF